MKQRTSLIIRELGHRHYMETWQAMREFTNNRTQLQSDELWFVTHPAVFTQGQAGKNEHILNPGDIPIIQTDRGGQVTYHGPGQLIAYVLFDIKRLQLSVRSLVSLLENVIITLLNQYNIKGHTRADAPGVYVSNKKICSLGLRIRKGFSYHGLALNITTDLEPFNRIHPCGFADMKVTKMSEHCIIDSIDTIKETLAHYFELNGYYEALIHEHNETII